MRQPPAASRLSVDPAGDLWGLAGAPILQGMVVYSPAYMYTTSSTQSSTCCFHHSCSAAFNAAGLLWAETPSKFQVQSFVFHPTQTDRDKKSVQPDGSLVACE